MVEVVYFMSECDPCGSQHPYAQYTLDTTCIAFLEWQIGNKLGSKAFGPVRLKFSVYFNITTYFFLFYTVIFIKYLYQFIYYILPFI